MKKLILFSLLLSSSISFITGNNDVDTVVDLHNSCAIHKSEPYSFNNSQASTVWGRLGCFAVRGRLGGLAHQIIRTNRLSVPKDHNYKELLKEQCSECWANPVGATCRRLTVWVSLIKTLEDESGIEQ